MDHNLPDFIASYSMKRIESRYICLCAADLDRQLQEDLKRLQIKDKIGTDEAVSRARVTAVAEEDTRGNFQDLIDKILIADFFFVLFALGWLAVGVGLKTSSGSTVRRCIHRFFANEFPYYEFLIIKCRLLNCTIDNGMQDVLDAWLSLWQWVFQPAIGVLMLGAVRVECLHLMTSSSKMRI
jgi:hypothetical protein